MVLHMDEQRGIHGRNGDEGNNAGNDGISMDGSFVKKKKKKNIIMNGRAFPISFQQCFYQSEASKDTNNVDEKRNETATKDDRECSGERKKKNTKATACIVVQKVGRVAITHICLAIPRNGQHLKLTGRLGILRR